jgi:hypothetical protein
MLRQYLGTFHPKVRNVKLAVSLSTTSQPHSDFKDSLPLLYLRYLSDLKDVVFNTSASRISCAIDTATACLTKANRSAAIYETRTCQAPGFA